MYVFSVCVFSVYVGVAGMHVCVTVFVVCGPTGWGCFLYHGTLCVLRVSFTLYMSVYVLFVFSGGGGGLVLIVVVIVIIVVDVTYTRQGGSVLGEPSRADWGRC